MLAGTGQQRGGRAVQVVVEGAWQGGGLPAVTSAATARPPHSATLVTR